jgi:general secretion pathway protein G
MKRAGFTMIELIFVIVILGILAAVAIPKLAATRNDAKVASEVTSMSQALQNLGAEYTAQGAFTNYDVNQSNKSVKCASFSSTKDGNVTLTLISKETTGCPQAVLDGVTTRATNNGLVDANGSKTYSFGGTGIAD